MKYLLYPFDLHVNAFFIILLQLIFPLHVLEFYDEVKPPTHSFSIGISTRTQ